MVTSVPRPLQPLPPPAAIPPQVMWRLSVEQYHEMIRWEILTDDDAVELLEGWLVSKMPKNPPHRMATKLTRTALEQLIPDGWYVDSQEPITLSDSSEPEPDVVVIRGETRDYFDRHPTASEIGLVIEISDSTLERDRTLKKLIYAKAGIPVYWIINLGEQCIEVYTQPAQQADEWTYLQEQVYSLADSIPIVFEEKEIGQIAAKDLLP
jgi:Uma2 family endonuclease